MPRRTFTPASKLPAHWDGLGACWCEPKTMIRHDNEGNPVLRTFHNDDLGCAFGLLPFPTMLLLTNCWSDDYSEEPAAGTNRR
jgi:hypothetical protein